MKNLNFVFGMAATAMLISMTACSNDYELTTTTGGVRPIVLTSSISNSQTRSIDQTLQNTAFASGAEVGVFVTATDDASYTNSTNVKATSDGSGNLSPTETLYYPTGDNSGVSIIAYAPYDESATLGEYSFTVKSDQSSDDDYIASDLLYASASSSNTDASVNLQFYHKLAKINVTFEGNTEYAKGKTVTIKGVATSTSINLSDGTIGEATGDTEDITAAEYGDDADTYTASAIIVPQTVSTFVVTIGSVECTLRYADFTFNEGIRYNFTATIPEEVEEEPATTYTELTLQSEVNDWNDYEENDYVFELSDINASINGDGTFNEETGILVTGEYGFGGWKFDEGLDLSDYKYLVLELGEETNITGAVDLRIFAENSYFAQDLSNVASFEINSYNVVIDLTNMAEQMAWGATDNWGLTEITDETRIYILGFWTYGGEDNEVQITKIYATNNPPAAVGGTNHYDNREK